MLRTLRKTRQMSAGFGLRRRACWPLDHHIRGLVTLSYTYLPTWWRFKPAYDFPIEFRPPCSRLGIKAQSRYLCPITTFFEIDLWKIITLLSAAAVRLLPQTGVGFQKISRGKMDFLTSKMKFISQKFWDFPEMVFHCKASSWHETDRAKQFWFVKWARTWFGIYRQDWSIGWLAKV